MIRNSSRWALAFTLILLSFADSRGLNAQAPWRGGVTHVDTVPGPSLRGNLIGDPAWREVTVYLPPGYKRDRTKRYPVVYLLHGFAADHRAFMSGPYQNLNVRISMDSLIESGAVRGMIVVMPNARNFFDGSFYMNSPVTGNWEDFIVKDLIGHVDRKYRTIRSRRGRGITGHSMGGFGALRIAMRNPDVYSAVYALSPCCLAEMNYPERRPAWKVAIGLKERSEYARAGFTANLLYAMAAAYSPNIDKPPFYADLPYRLESDSLVAIPEILSKWKGPLAMAATRIDALKQLAIAFDAGNADALTDIPVNVRALDSLLTARGVPHTSEIYPGTHGSGVRSRLEASVFPFFSRELR
jgi:S-formylglutathione hydrolase